MNSDASWRNDPNFPAEGLSITPSYESYSINGTSQLQDSQEDIEAYGIAGRVWEAAYLFRRYLSPLLGVTDSHRLTFDPPFQSGESSLELGAGVGLVGIHLARVSKQVILTDLENVLPLLRRNVLAQGAPNILVRPLPWGSTEHADAIMKEVKEMDVTQIICSDLVYFPSLLPPLLRSLLYLTEVPRTVLISYKKRSLAKEEPFWRAFGAWFDFSIVMCRQEGKQESWRRFGSLSSDLSDSSCKPMEDQFFLFSARRKTGSLRFTPPCDDEQLMAGYQVEKESGKRISGTGMETFELILMGSL